MLRDGSANPLTVHGLRELERCPPHFVKVQFELKTKKGEIERTVELLPKVIQNKLNSQKNSLQQLEQSVKLMDPIQVLKRGYSITLMDGKTVTENTEIIQGKTIITKTYFGEIESQVVKKKDS